MRDIPIIFSGPMVRALLAGRKTMTRRLAWRPWHLGALEFSSEEMEEYDALGWNVTQGHDELFYVAKPSPWQRVKPGDRLWVRESVACECRDAPIYSADLSEEGRTHWKFRPSIHMPRWASRLTLVVGAVKIERLQDISEGDAIAEGCERAIAGQGDQGAITTYRTGFVYLWGSLHGTDSWLANPGVAAITFTVHRQNIDALQAAA